MKSRIAPAAVVVVFFGILLWLSLSELNPDWIGYRLIFESEGAWLGENGRDPAFLGLTSLLFGLLGPDGYESYRLIFAIYFFVFITSLASGLISSVDVGKGSWLAMPLAFIYLGFTRFTIQIREGLAVTLVLAAFAMFRRVAAIRPSQQPVASPASSSIGGWLLLSLAAATHGSMAIVLAIALAATWIEAGRRESAGLLKTRMSILWAVALVGGTLLMGQLLWGGSLEDLAAETLGDRLVEDKSPGLMQFAFWCLYAPVCTLVRREAMMFNRVGRSGQLLGTTLEVIAGPVIFTVLLSILASVAFDISPLVMSSYVRLLYLLLGLVIAQLAIVGQTSWRLTAVCVFLLADQVRTIAAAILAIFGVDIL